MLNVVELFLIGVLADLVEVSELPALLLPVMKKVITENRSRLVEHLGPRNQEQETTVTGKGKSHAKE
jgi:hypothetical protein